MDVVALYRLAVERVPAYRAYLEKRCGTVPDVSSAEDLAALPFTSKGDYIKAYPLEELCLDGTLRGKHVLCRSSGTKGKPFFWPQLPEQERYVADWLYSDLDESFSLSTNPVFAVVSLALGSWISGELTSWGLRNLGVQKGGLTMVTPGLDLDEAVDLLGAFAGQFAGTVLYSYPPFARTILEKAADRGLPLASYRLGLRLAGEGYSERYRDHLNGLMGYEAGALHSIVSGYGSTDFGSLGKETTLAIAIRRCLYERGLARAVLGRDEIPSLCQYDPSAFHVERDGEELVVSKYQAVPLLRYRTGDRATLIGYDEMMERLRDAGADPLDLLFRRGGALDRVRELPFVLVWGRIDGGVTFCGANILVEQIREIVEGQELFCSCCTGQFQIRKRENEALEPVLEILLELRPGATGDPAEMAAVLASRLAESSTDYALIRQKEGNKALPRIRFTDDGELFGGTKFRYVG
ncbi:MAG: hypothetical protein JMJ93_01045 [Synergistaceae bacterium]|jgi:phenylacetate-CoA ligase|nr:hypothetical protein [Synergistaceae bacterium]